MVIILSYEYVKHYIEIESMSGCKLISKEYKNSISDLDILCKCGNTFKKSFNLFKVEKVMHCDSCSKKTKWTHDKVKKYLKERNYELISKYKYIKSKIKITDKYGYLYYITFDSFLHNNTNIRFINKSNPYTIQNIKLWCKLNNKPFELVSNTYESADKNKLKWKCLKDNCGEIFESSWSNISNGNGCGVCVGKQLGKSKCLAIKNPELAKEWHPTKNRDLTPYDVTCGSHNKIWWLCKDGHEWEAQIRSRINKNCPYCTGFYPTNKYNLLLYKPEICKEWNYKKNNKLPHEYTPNSNKDVWWICSSCNFEWKAKINNRISLLCPICTQPKGEKKIEEFLIGKLINYEYQKTFEDLIGLGGRLLSYDFYLHSYNLLIEYQGQFHDETAYQHSEIKLKTQKEHDRRKKQYTLDNNINFLEIWYWDFDNIEDILEKELKL